MQLLVDALIRGDKDFQLVQLAAMNLSDECVTIEKGERVVQVEDWSSVFGSIIAIKKRGYAETYYSIINFFD